MAVCAIHQPVCRIETRVGEVLEVTHHHLSAVINVRRWD
jgi:hypothetical protein